MRIRDVQLHGSRKTVTVTLLFTCPCLVFFGLGNDDDHTLKTRHQLTWSLGSQNPVQRQNASLSVRGIIILVQILRPICVPLNRPLNRMCITLANLIIICSFLDGHP